MKCRSKGNSTASNLDLKLPKMLKNKGFSERGEMTIVSKPDFKGEASNNCFRSQIFLPLIAIFLLFSH